MPEFEILLDTLGYYITDEYGGEHPYPWARFPTHADAQTEVEWLIANYEPPSPPGWEGGFAANH